MHNYCRNKQISNAHRPVKLTSKRCEQFTLAGVDAQVASDSYADIPALGTDALVPVLHEAGLASQPAERATAAAWSSASGADTEAAFAAQTQTN